MKVILFGAGDFAQRVLETLPSSYRVVAMADNDPSVQGKVIHGLPVIAPREIPEWQPEGILITCLKTHQREIRDQLKGMSLEHDVISPPPGMDWALIESELSGDLESKLRKVRRIMESASDDKLERFRVLTELGSLLLPEYRFKWPSMDWWMNEEFQKYLVQFSEDRSHNCDRKWNLAQLQRLTLDVPGDTAEVGVFQGASSWLILKQGNEHRHHWMFDSFEGLSKPGEQDGVYWKEGDLKAPMAMVRENLREFDGRFTLLPGWVPDRFEEVADRTFSFVHIDVDLYEPTLASIRFFYPRMKPGGIIVCDDLGFDTCPGATSACEDALGDFREKFVTMADGGGFFVKGVATSQGF